VDEGHSDLRGRIVPTVDFVEGGGRSFIEDTHGTAVASVKAVDFVINAGVHILNLSLGGPRSTPRPPRLMSQA
jgi:subtilisin family serine protease